MRKNVIVTGCNGGLGFSIVDQLIKSEEYFIIGTGSKQKADDKLLGFIQQKKMTYFQLDLAFPEEIKGFYFDQLKSIGPIHGLVNNAAYAYDDLCSNANLGELEKMFKINTISPILLTKYCIRDMILHGIRGSIIHVSSVSAHTGYKGLSMYAASKGALESFSRTIAREYGTRGIRSNCIAPGFMETGMSNTLSSEQKARIYNRTSLKKSTSLQSVAFIVLNLLSHETESITGSTIHIDNGTI